MTNQPEALRLADKLLALHGPTDIDERAAAELRRLHTLNQELLEALETAFDQTCSVGRQKDWKQISEAITALRAALEQPSNVKQVIELYDSPEQPAREPLTDEQIDALDCIQINASDWNEYEVHKPSVRAFVRAIEAAHGIKELK